MPLAKKNNLQKLYISGIKFSKSVYMGEKL
jgi:hypothetical protein